MDHVGDPFSHVAYGRVPASGYFHRSLLDGWSGAAEWRAPTGLDRVDPESLERTHQASFRHYHDLIRHHGVVEVPTEPVRP